MAYSLARRDFEHNTLRVLRLARAALIYLSLGMDQEEARRISEEAKAIKPQFRCRWSWRRGMMSGSGNTTNEAGSAAVINVDAGIAIELDRADI
ncbi:MAG: hypothetical protein ACLPTZ_29655, partial [Beijerinckiaceae bacterium]